MPWPEGGYVIGRRKKDEVQEKVKEKDDGTPKLNLKAKYKKYVGKNNPDIFLQDEHMFDGGYKYVGEYSPQLQAKEKNEPGVTIKDMEEDKGPKQMFKCDECGKEFDDYRKMKVHMTQEKRWKKKNEKRKA